MNKQQITELADLVAELPPEAWHRRLWREVRWVPPYRDGTLLIFYVPFLTIAKTREGVMVYHDYYSDRQVWLPFPQWVVERQCGGCGGFIWPWQQRAWWRGAFEMNIGDRWEKVVVPLHAHCARIVERSLTQELPKP